MNTTTTMTIADILSQIESVMTATNKSELQLTLQRIISRIENKALDDDCGYCTVFVIPAPPFLNLYTFLKLKKEDVSSAFQSDWQYGNGKKMYGSSFYHILLLLVGWGIEHKNPAIYERALFLILAKLWNGRKRRYVQYCDKGTMLVTIENLVRPNSLLKKHDSPTLLIKNHYVPTLIKTYSGHVIQDASIGLKKLFSQSWNRLDQIFANKYEFDAKKNKNIAKNGLLPLYMQAKEQGYRIKGTAIDISSLNIVDDSSRNFLYRSVLKDLQRAKNPGIIELTLIRMNSNTEPSYQESFLKIIHDETMVSRKVITVLLKALHKPEYKVVVGFILRYLHERIDKKYFSGKGIEIELSKKIFMRRNDVDAQRLKEGTERFICKVFAAKEYRTSSLQRMRKIIYFICAFNLGLTHAQNSNKGHPTEPLI